MNTYIPVLVGLIAAVTSVTAAIHASRKERSLTTLKAHLADWEGERAARRDYVYEARKRLYQECEPVLFQLSEQSEGAFYHIRGLAKFAKQGNLGAHPDSWLAREGYYFLHTLYRLTSPLALVQVFWRKVTLVDCTLDPQVNALYALSKCLYVSAGDDYDFARRAELKGYDPEPQGAGWETKRKRHPERYWRQGVMRGWLDQAVETLIVQKSQEPERCMSFGEFFAAYQDGTVELREKFDVVADIYTEFHPLSRPVLWQMLVTQAHIYKTFIDVRSARLQRKDAMVIPWQSISQLERRDFDWRQRPEEAPDSEVVIRPFSVAEEYLQEKLPATFQQGIRILADEQG
jgi:hypothetical protein